MCVPQCIHLKKMIKKVPTFSDLIQAKNWSMVAIIIRIYRKEQWNRNFKYEKKILSEFFFSSSPLTSPESSQYSCFLFPGLQNGNAVIGDLKSLFILSLKFYCYYRGNVVKWSLPPSIPPSLPLSLLFLSLSQN